MSVRSSLPTPDDHATGHPTPMITWAGHATVSIRLDGVHLLTDPALRRRISVLRRHAPPVPAHVTRGVDAVLLSHLHRDHLDLPSLRQLGTHTPIIVPAGGGALLRRRGFQRVQEVRAGETATIGPLTVEAWPALHPGARTRFGPEAEALGYLVRGSAAVYFAGDTDLFDEMHDLRGRVDVALLPVGGWGPTLGEGHLNAERAAEALRRIAPQEAVPVHWGTYWPLGLPRLDLPGPGRARGPLYVDAARGFCERARSLAPRVRPHLLRPGGQLAAGAGA